MLFSNNLENTKYPLVICYYTINTIYEKEVQNLIKSLNKFKIPYKIYGIFSLGSWLLNTGFKAEFTQIMMEKNDTHLIWLDADSMVYNTPHLFVDLKNADETCCVRIKGNITEPNLNSSVIYFNNKIDSKNIINDWVMECKKHNYQIWDQKCLENVFMKNPSLYSLFPLTYAKKSKKTGKRVIMLNQISNISVDIIDNEKDVLRFICSKIEIISYIHDNLSYENMTKENIINLNESVYNKSSKTYSFNPYIFLLTYPNMLHQFVFKEKYNSNINIKDYIDFEGIYLYYIKNKLKLKLQSSKYNLDHFFATDVLHSYLNQ